MPAWPDYTITIVDFNHTIDVTDLCTGFSTEIKVGIAELGKASATVTLDNDDGRFTPYEGGGTGTYRYLDWYSQTIQIVNDTTRVVFDGVIRDISFDDNGVNSTMTITAVDWLSAASSEVVDAPAVGSLGTPGESMTRALQGIAGWGPGVTLPYFGDSTATQNPVCFDQGTGSTKTAMVALTSVTAHDIIATVIMPAGPSVHFPGAITFQQSPRIATYRCDVVDYTLNKTFAEGGVIFDENPSATTSADARLPFSKLEIGYSDDLLTTTATVQSGVALAYYSFTSTNTDAEERYGSRARTYLDIGEPGLAAVTQSAEFWTQRAAEVRYVPIRIETRTSVSEAALGNLGRSKMNDLLAMQTVPFSVARITYTATNGAQVDVPMVITGRKVNATPSDTRIILDMIPAVDWQSFVLDDDLLGILGDITDQYDEATIEYDQLGFDYDGETLVGNRLG